jgi:class 3 adenylate cyclase
MAKTTHLSAIFFSDIEGYTSMMQKDEEGTLILLDKYQQTLAKYVGKYDGEIVKNYGDGSICLFSSAVASVKCAVDIQQELRLTPEVPLRIGLNLGDVHRKGGDVYGDSINVASRLESMGIAGNILLSQSMYIKVKNHPEFDFQSLGNFNFKNVDHTLEIFAVSNEGFAIPRRKNLTGKFKKRESKLKRLWPLGILAIAAVVYFAQTEYGSNTFASNKEVKHQIAVLEFDNNTGNPEYDIAGKMAVDWILHGITQYEVGQVISPEIIKDYSKALQKASVIPILTDYLKPSKIIKGNFFLNNDRLLFQSSITDEIMGKTLISLNPVECDSNSPLICIEELKQRILGYLIEDEKSQNLQEKPPKFEAYQYLLQAKKEQFKNDEEHLRLLDLAIASDSTYFEPKTYKFVHYYNSGDYAVADSLLQELLISTESNNRQRNLYKFYEALLQGNSKNAYRYYQKEYNFEPLDMEINSTMMTIALQVANNPRVVDSIYRKIDMIAMDLKECNYCEDRYYIKALSDIELKNYKEATDLLAKFGTELGQLKLKKILVRAHNKMGNTAIADSLLSNVQITSKPHEWMELFLFNARDLLDQDKKARATIYLDKIIDAIEQSGDNIKNLNNKILAASLFFKEEYEQAEIILEKALQLQPNLIEHNAMLAIVYQRNGKADRAKRQLANLESLRGKYQYGDIDYALAQYYAAMGDNANTTKHLIKAVAAGRWYDANSFQNDPLFKGYSQKEDFKRVMNFSN